MTILFDSNSLIQHFQGSAGGSALENPRWRPFTQLTKPKTNKTRTGIRIPRVQLFPSHSVPYVRRFHSHSWKLNQNYDVMILSTVRFSSPLFSSRMGRYFGKRFCKQFSGSSSCFPGQQRGCRTTEKLSENILENILPEERPVLVQTYSVTVTPVSVTTPFQWQFG